MAEWVQKGNLKGPQGDPGQDAQLPAGGTEGQVLTKTSGGEAWADAPQPDMTGVVKVVTGQDSTPYLTTGGVAVPAVALTNTIPDSGEPESYAMIHTGIGYALSTFFGSGNTVNAGIGVSGGTAILTMNNKSAYSITDAISDSPAGDALVTDKAVADYVTAKVPSVTLPLPVSQGGTGATTAEGVALMVFEHAPEASPTQAGVVKTLSDEDFCAYMGMEYDPADWS